MAASQNAQSTLELQARLTQRLLKVAACGKTQDLLLVACELVAGAGGVIRGEGEGEVPLTRAERIVKIVHDHLEGKLDAQDALRAALCIGDDSMDKDPWEVGSLQNNVWCHYFAASHLVRMLEEAEAGESALVLKRFGEIFKATCDSISYTRSKTSTPRSRHFNVKWSAMAERQIRYVRMYLASRAAEHPPEGRLRVSLLAQTN